MKMNPLGRTGLTMSEWCLGTMTWGTQTDEADAHRQMDMALERGINIVDTAEMYPVNPVSKDHWGRTEEILGTWNAANPARREAFLLATKVSGAGMKAVRDGTPISPATIREAIDGSLRRLQTDFVDIYQLHWPNRGSYHFRQNWSYDPAGGSRAEVLEHMEDVLDTCAALIREGKLRHLGMSNETAWGLAQWLRLSEDKGLPRVVTVQNEYSLMCRLYDTDMAELSVMEDVGLLAFSPLAAGMLTGKYGSGEVPEGSRKSLSPNLGGRDTERSGAAVEAYVSVARKHGLDPVHMALAWCNTRSFMGSAIFGATSAAQLSHILDGTGLELSREVLDDLDAAHRAHPLPY